jgi:trk system potassium uptake protein TrkA
MEVLIVGGGLTGETLAERLAQNGHDVVVVERDPETARRLSSVLDVQVVQGSGTTSRLLREAGIERCDVVVAITENDDANMVVAMLAASVFRVPRLLARLRDPDHVEDFRRIAGERGAAYRCINPDSAAVDRILALLAVPGAIDVAPFMDGELLVAGFRIKEGSDLAGLLVKDMSLLFANAATLVVAIQRAETWRVPHGDEVMTPGDIAYFAISRSDLSDVVALVRGEPLETPDGRRRRVIVSGATRIGLELAQRLEAQDLQVVLIEQDPESAGHAAELLERTLVVRGRATEQALLEEEEIERASAFVAVSTDFENNLVAGLMARRLGAERAFALVDNPDLVHLIGEISIDAIISPRLLAVSLALQHVRGGGVRTVAALLEHEIEVIEGEAAEGAKLVKRPLADVELPRGMLVAARRRDGRILVPRGGDRVEPGDRVLVIATSENAPRVAQLLTR